MVAMATFLDTGVLLSRKRCQQNSGTNFSWMCVSVLHTRTLCCLLEECRRKDQMGYVKTMPGCIQLKNTPSVYNVRGERMGFVRNGVCLGLFSVVMFSANNPR